MVVRFEVIFFEDRNFRNFLFMNEVSRFEWIYVGILISENSDVRYLMIVFVDILGYGKINGNREYLLIIIRKYLFSLFVGRGFLKSMLIFLNG